MLYSQTAIIAAVRHFAQRLDDGKLHPSDEPTEAVGLIIASEGSLAPATLDAEFRVARWDYAVAGLLTDEQLDAALQQVDAAIAKNLPQLIGDPQ